MVQQTPFHSTSLMSALAPESKHYSRPNWQVYVIYTECLGWKMGAPKIEGPCSAEHFERA